MLVVAAIIVIAVAVITWLDTGCAPGNRSMFEGVSVFAVIVVAFIVIAVLMGVRQVPQGYNYTVERFGKYSKTLTPGLGRSFLSLTASATSSM